MPHFFATMFMAIFMAQIDISGGFWGSLFQGLRRAKVVPQVGLKNAITVSLEEYSDVIVSRFIVSHGSMDSTNHGWRG